MGIVSIAKGEINTLNNLFKTQIGIKDKKLHLSNIDYVVPKKFQNNIVFIEGLVKNFYNNKLPNAKYKKNDNVDDNYSGREVINRLYNISLNLSYANVSVGSIEYEGESGFLQGDLLISENLNNINNNSVDNIVGPDKPFDTETQLDIQMMGINADNATIWFWDDNNWLYSLASSMANSINTPDIISMSWGWSESNQCTIIYCNNHTSENYVNRVNYEYIKLGLRGITIVVASGDSGAPGRTNEACESDMIKAVFPGSSPWVTSVGGGIC